MEAKASANERAALLAMCVLSFLSPYPQLLRICKHVSYIREHEVPKAKRNFRGKTAFYPTIAYL